MKERGEPGKGATMLTDHLLETIQADRNRQIREADRVRMMTPPDDDPVEPRAATPARRQPVAPLPAAPMGRHVRPATDGSR